MTPSHTSIAATSRPASPRLRQQGFVNLHRKPLFVLLVAALVTYLAWMPDPWPLAERMILPLQILGILVMLAGLVGRVFATLSIGGRKDREIVRTELYSICRNPLYLGSFLISLGLGLLSCRLDFTALAGGSFLAIFYPMMRNEAAFLRERFEEFADYERSVPLFFPNLLLWRERSRFEVDFKRVKRTLLDASVVVPLIPLVLCLRHLS